MKNIVLTVFAVAVLAVAIVDRLKSGLVVVDLDKREPTRVSSETVAHEGERI